MFTKLDRIARTATSGFETVKELLDHGVAVHVLNMDLVDNTPTGRLILQIMLSFAEFEREMIKERTAAGKAIARQKPGYKEGRPKQITPEIIKQIKKEFQNLSKTLGFKKKTRIYTSTYTDAGSDWTFTNNLTLAGACTPQPHSRSI